ncbi:MAG: hypothetical protein P1U58_17085 [Verrucomicrobiales bacterium]|nr:hypothetical protein [Verrucomicrobiales bacterium]
MPEETDKIEYTRSQKRFMEAPEMVQNLVREFIQQERPVMHMLRRPDIHQKLLAIVKKHVS